MANNNFLFVGAGITNATIYAKLKEYFESRNEKFSATVIDKRAHIGGNCYDVPENDYFIHKYGPHIFHTSNKEVWNFVNKFAEFKPYFTQVMATDLEQVYNLPYNMNTFNKFWPELKTPAEVRNKIKDEYVSFMIDGGRFFVEKDAIKQAIKQVGTTVYEKLIEPYSRKQWGCKPTEFPKAIFNRLPVRFSYDNNYFNDTYQGLPIGGYANMIDKMFEGAEIRLNTDFLRSTFFTQTDKYDAIFYSGSIDELYNTFKRDNQRFLPYRSLKFVETMESNTQGSFIMTYDTDKVPYTRVTEPVYQTRQPNEDEEVRKIYEFPVKCEEGLDPYYPIDNSENRYLYYCMHSELFSNSKIIPVGRLGTYKYLNMDAAILEAMKVANETIEKRN